MFELPKCDVNETMLQHAIRPSFWLFCVCHSEDFIGVHTHSCRFPNPPALSTRRCSTQLDCCCRQRIISSLKLDNFLSFRTSRSWQIQQANDQKQFMIAACLPRRFQDTCKVGLARLPWPTIDHTNNTTRGRHKDKTDAGAMAHWTRSSCRWSIRHCQRTHNGETWRRQG